MFYKSKIREVDSIVYWGFGDKIVWKRDNNFERESKIFKDDIVFRKIWLLKEFRKVIWRRIWSLCREKS